MERYEAYKDSGVEWIGEVPEHWGVVYPKALFSLRKDKARSEDVQLTASQKYGVIPQSLFMELENQRVVTVITGEEILKHVELGDFVISMRSFQGGLEYSEHSGKISSAYVMVEPNKEMVFPSFFKYVFKSAHYIQALQSTSNLVRDGQAMRFSNFIQVYLPLPGIAEQKAVADYLDEKTAEIDSIVSETERSIELLREYRKSVISEAVTKGLDPNAPMKDSGVEWIGEIPAVWDVARMSNFVRFHSGDSLDSTLLKSESPYPVYGGGNVKGRYDQSNISAGSVLVSRQGATCGAARYIASAAWATEHALIATKLCTMDSRWLAYFLGNMNLGQYSMTAAQPGISADKIESLPIVVASTWEQERIADYLDAKTSEIDALIADKERQVELLKEYRKSLISEAVTGKFKVPGVS